MAIRQAGRPGVLCLLGLLTLVPATVRATAVEDSYLAGYAAAVLEREFHVRAARVRVTPVGAAVKADRLPSGTSLAVYVGETGRALREGVSMMRLHDFLDFQARERSGMDFAVQGARRITYREAVAEANRLANGLVAAGLAKGDRIAFLGKNSIEHALMFYAASKAGVVPVPLNYRLAAPELAYILNDSRAKLALVARDFVATIDGIRRELDGVERVVAFGADSLPSGWVDLRAWLRDQPDTPPAREISSEDDVYQMYTSGTTGRPKGAVLTHRAVTANAIQMMVGMSAPGSEERTLVVAPLYHAAAAVTSFIAVLSGACLYIQEDFNPLEVVRVLSEEGITTTTLVPAMIQACLVMVPDVAERRYDRLRLMAYGGSPISEQTLRRALEVFRCDFSQGYGMTETTAALTMLNTADHRRALAENPGLLLSAGRALIATDVRVVDENDRPLAPGAIGEVVGRGPQNMRGYCNLPDASS
ncbi:MAG: AMP-binding protein [Candidatus Binatia bacterium]